MVSKEVETKCALAAVEKVTILPDIKASDEITSTALIYLSDGRKMTIDQITTTVSHLEDTIQKTFHLHRNDIVAIYHGFPAEKMSNNDELMQLEGKFLIQLKEKPVKLIGTPETNMLSSILRMYALSEVYQAFVGTSYFWQYLEKNPQLFRKNGIIYNCIDTLVRLVDDRHYRLTYFLPNQVLVYNQSKDCIELCVRNKCHFEVNENLPENVSTIEYYISELNVPRLSGIGKPHDVTSFTGVCTIRKI